MNYLQYKFHGSTQYWHSYKKSLVEFEPKVFFGFAELSHTVTWEQEAVCSSRIHTQPKSLFADESDMALYFYYICTLRPQIYVYLCHSKTQPREV